VRKAQAGDIVLLVSDQEKRQLLRQLEPGHRFETHRGVLEHDDLIGRPLGSMVRTHLGFPYYLILPTTADLIQNIRRTSQIIYAKDAGYLALKLGIVPGARVIEAGSGSGAMCTVLAALVGDEGHVYSYDVREDMLGLAQRNLEWNGLVARVTLEMRDVTQGFGQEDVDAVFLDMPEPWEALPAAWEALRGGGMLATILPSVHQLGKMIDALQTSRSYGLVEAEELLLRSYRTIPTRVRPDDQMVAHTGYLVFARAVIRE
jgi:tRNA (adenine57-N1/adenine58-N1)-methyltransferase